MKKRPLAMVCLMGIIFLFLSTKLVKASPPVFLEWEGKAVKVVGEVYQKETYFKADKEVAVVYLKLSSVICDGKQADIQSGDYRVICYLKSNQNMPKTGSIVRATGVMQCFEKATNPGQFDAESYYQFLKISFQLNQTEIQQQSQTYHKGKEALYHLRCRLSAVFDRTLPQKDASVMKTIMLGEKKAVDAERKELYQKSGIAHILAISGLHISLIGMTIFSVLKRIGLPIGVYTVIPTLFILLYGCMTGFSVSVLRAIGMFLIHMTGRLCRRTYDMITAVAVMAVLLLIEQPLHFYNSSFLLSFGCVLAIALLIPALTKKRLKKEKELSGQMLKIAGGAVISAAILPLQMWFFYQIPIYSVILNLLVIPLMSLLLPAGMLLLVTGNSGGVLQQLAAYLITGILKIYDVACEVSGSLPGAFLQTGRPTLWGVLCYFMILLLIVIWQRRLSLKKKWLIFSVAILFLLWPVSKGGAIPFWHIGQEECSITFLDVGQGDCIYIASESGKHYLIDGGSSDVSKVGEYRILPYLKYQGVSELEAVFVTHPDEDHCNGILELLSRASQEQLLINRLCLPDIDEAAKSEAYAELVQAARQAEVEVVYFSKGMCLQDDTLTLQCLHPAKGCVSENENAYSLVFLLQYGDFQVLLTGDVEQEGEAELIRTLRELAESHDGTVNVREIEVLKVAHHGSRYSTGEELLEVIDPKLAIISCGANNSYGHPHKETMDRLKEIGAEVLTTPVHGAITVEVGEEIKVYGFTSAYKTGK